MLRYRQSPVLACSHAIQTAIGYRDKQMREYGRLMPVALEVAKEPCSIDHALSAEPSLRIRVFALIQI
jgi:hypothetical protein